MENSIKFFRYNEPYEYFNGTMLVNGHYETLVFKVTTNVYNDPNALQKLKNEKENKFGTSIKYIIINEDTGLFQTFGDLGLQNHASEIVKAINPHYWEDWDLFYKHGV